MKGKWFLKDERISVLHTKRPRGKAVFGRAWQHASVSVNGYKCPAEVDGTWGHWVYFEYRGDWFKFDVHPIGAEAFDNFDLTWKEK